MPQVKAWLFKRRSVPKLALVLVLVASFVTLASTAALLTFWDAAEPLTLVVVYSAVLAATLLVFALLSPSALDRGLSDEAIKALAELSKPPEGADRGTEGAKTYYTWREDQWRQISRGLGALAASLIIALLAGVVISIETTTSTETKSASTGSSTPTPAVQGTAAKSPAVQNPHPTSGAATQTTPTAAAPPADTTKRTASQVPIAIWAVVVDLVVVAGFAATLSRQAHHDYARDLQRIADSP